jgi:curved DNA-binding protein CbpA
MERNYYQILGITQDAPEKEIKRAYHKLARELHPDKSSTSKNSKQLEEEFALVSKAYNTLKDREKRTEYDKRLKTNTHARISIPKKEPERKSTEVLTDPASCLKIAQKAYNRGLQYYKMGEYSRAIDFFEAAIRTYDKEPSFYAKLALTLFNSRRGFTKAVESCRKAIELDPYNVDYKLVLAEIYESAGSYSLAKKTYEDVLKWDSNNEKAMQKIDELDKSKFKGSFINKLISKLRK